MNQGDRSFIFEPIEPQGGSWLGVLAVDDDSAANILAESQSAWEIPAEKYAELKKKRAGAVTNQGFVPSQTPQPPPLSMEASAARAGLSSEGGGEKVGGEVVAGAALAPIIPSTTLKTTSAKPPFEPLIDRQAKDPARKKAA